MKKRVICIDCPKGCALTVEAEGGRLIDVSGNECPKGEKYAASEVENPTRVLTSTVLAEGLSLKLVPVRTDRPIPKGRIFEAMERIKIIRIRGPVNAGDVIEKDILSTGADLIATRGAR